MTKKRPIRKKKQPSKQPLLTGREMTEALYATLPYVRSLARDVRRLQSHVDMMRTWLEKIDRVAAWLEIEENQRRLRADKEMRLRDGPVRVYRTE